MCARFASIVLRQDSSIPSIYDGMKKGSNYRHGQREGNEK